MDTQDFTNDEWQDMLDEFRLLVVRAGFADWDAAMAVALNDFGDRDGRRIPIGAEAAIFELPAIELLRLYARQFMTFLKSGSRWPIDENRARLADLLRTENDIPVDNIFVLFNERMQPIDARADDIAAMVDEIGRFLSELHGEDTGFWDDTPDAPGER